MAEQIWLQDPLFWDTEGCGRSSYCKRTGHCYQCLPGHNWAKCDHCMNVFRKEKVEDSEC